MSYNIRYSDFSCSNPISQPYHSRGLGCCSYTTANTSNHKFLPLKASVYWDRYNYMKRYPGSGSYYDPAEIIRSRKDNIKHFLNKPVHPQCKGCYLRE